MVAASAGRLSAKAPSISAGQGIVLPRSRDVSAGHTPGYASRGAPHDLTSEIGGKDSACASAEQCGETVRQSEHRVHMSQWRTMLSCKSEMKFFDRPRLITECREEAEQRLHARGARAQNLHRFSVVVKFARRIKVSEAQVRREQRRKRRSRVHRSLALRVRFCRYSNSDSSSSSNFCIRPTQPAGCPAERQRCVRPWHRAPARILASPAQILH